MRVWKNFKTLGAALPNLRNRNCWLSCYKCNRSWKETLTKMVHMVQLVIEKKPDTRFVCDDCVKEMD